LKNKNFTDILLSDKEQIVSMFSAMRNFKEKGIEDGRHIAELLFIFIQ